MKITFLFGNNSNELSGGYKVIFQYASYIDGRGHQVTLYFYADRTLKVLPKAIPDGMKKLYARTKNKFIPTWYPLSKSVHKKVIFTLDEIEDGDVIIATAIRTARPVASLPESKGKKFYFVQGFENWNCSDDDVYETYMLGMNHIVVLRWLKCIVDKYAAEESYLIPNGLDSKIFFARISFEDRHRHSVVMHYRSDLCKGCRYLPDSCRYNRNASQNKVSEINNYARVFLCSSIEEGFGLPGLEAMACGCVFVSSTFQGILEYAENGVNSLLVPAGDSQSLASAVTRAFEDEDTASRLADNGKKKAGEFDVSKAAEKFMRMLTGFGN